MVKNYPPFIEAMKKRGIDDMDLVMVDPWLVEIFLNLPIPSPLRIFLKSNCIFN